MVVSKLKNLRSHYNINFVGFMPIYYVINLDIVLSSMIFSYLFLGSMICKFESIKLFFL